MKVLLIAYNDSINVWKRHFTSELEAMGITVISPVDLGLDIGWERLHAGKDTASSRAASTERLLEKVKALRAEGGVDCVLAMIRQFQFFPEVFKQIESLGTPTVIYECDNLNSAETRKKLSPFFTMTGVAEADALPLFARDGLAHVHLPMASNPKYFYPVKETESKEVTFIGSKNSYRRWLLGSAMTKGLPLEIFGGGWHPATDYYQLDFAVPDKTPLRQTRLEKAKRWLEFRRSSLTRLMLHGPGIIARTRRNELVGNEYEALVAAAASKSPLSFEAVLQVFAQSKVSLGINHYIPPNQHFSLSNTYSRNRDLEAPMAGACYLTEYCRELELLYPEPDVIWTLRDVDELLEKADYLRTHDSFRVGMRERAHRYAMKHHRWTNRFELLFRTLGLSKLLTKERDVA